MHNHHDIQPIPFNPAQPADLEAEQSLLGTLLANNKAYGAAHQANSAAGIAWRGSSDLQFKHFADPIHAAYSRPSPSGLKKAKS